MLQRHLTHISSAIDRIQEYLTDHMDMRSLFAWRHSSKSNYRHSCSCLKRTLQCMLKCFFPCVESFLQALGDCQGVLGGEFALAYMLRSTGLIPKVLEVFVPTEWFHAFIENLLINPVISPFFLPFAPEETDGAFAEQRCITMTAPFVTTQGLGVWVHESDSISPAMPIARTWTSGLINFVTEYGFGSAYPRLTLDKKGLLSTACLGTLTDDDTYIASHMQDIGFSFAISPTDWPEYFYSYPIADDYSQFPCLRDTFLCPNQGRYFGDQGSFVAFMDPLSVEPAIAKTRGIMPYGHTAIWRLCTTGYCNRLCAVKDDILAPGTLSLPLYFVADHNLPVHTQEDMRYDSPEPVSSPSMLTERPRSAPL